jgi:zinc transport system substrate-binding protein
VLHLTQAASASPATPNIVVVTAPLTPYVNAIMQGTAKAQNLLRPGQDPHHFALSPSQAAMLAEADVMIVPDLGMNPAIAQMIAKNPHIKVIELSKLDGANPLPYAKENPWLASLKQAGHEKDEDVDARLGMPALKPTPDPNYKHLDDFDTTKKIEDKTPTLDPHFWLDPERMAAIALPLAHMLSEINPAQRITFEANAQLLTDHLRHEVIPGMQKLMSGHQEPPPVAGDKPIIPFITYHAAYQYFLARFALTNTGDITTRPEDYLGAQTLDQLLKTASKVHIRCIIGEANSPLVERIAKLSEARVVLLSPEQLVDPKTVPVQPWVKNDYDRFLYQTAKNFGDCL